MKKKNFYFILLAVLFIVLGYFITVGTFPKNANRYPAFIVLLLIDYYVWGIFKQKVYTYSRLVKVLSVFIYWLPFVLLIASTIAAYFVKPGIWNPLIKNIVFGGIFTFYTAKFFMAILLGFADLIAGFRKIIQLFKRRKKDEGVPKQSLISRAKFMENMAFITGGLVVSSMFFGMFKWVHDFNFNDVFVRIKNLPGAFENYTIVQISDLHLGTWSTVEPMKEAVNQINALEPDLIVFTGDLVNYSSDEAIRFKDVLSGLKASDGIYAVLGNHDYGDYVSWPSKADKQKNMESLYQFYNQINWKLLRNEHVIIEKGDDKLALIGVENWSVNTRFPQFGNILKASKGIGKVPVKILLSHDPSHWEAGVIPNHKDIDLMLAGHTHGFQFGIEIPAIKWSPAQYIYQQWAGLYQNNETQQQLYVNRGLGSIGYPGRIGILPEVTIIHLET